MKILKVEQDTEAWHRLRSQYVTATEANRLKNQDNWEEMVKNKLKRVRTTFKNAAMIKGNEREPEARDTINNVIGGNTEFRPMCVVDNTIGAMASLDGGEPSLSVILEIKCPEKDEKSDLYYKALEKKIPSQYRDQMQFQMMVTGAANAIYMVYAGDNKYQIIMVNRDEIHIKMLKDLTIQFWEYADNYINDLKIAA